MEELSVLLGLFLFVGEVTASLTSSSVILITLQLRQYLFQSFIIQYLQNVHLFTRQISGNTHIRVICDLVFVI